MKVGKKALSVRRKNNDHKVSRNLFGGVYSMAENDDPSQGQQSGGESGQNQDPNAGGVKTVKIGNVDVPQDAFDAMIKDRIADVKDSIRGEFKKKYSDHDTLREKAKKFDELEAAKKTDEEKAATKLKELRDQIEANEKELADRTLRDLKRSKVEHLLAEKKISLPDGATVSDIIDFVGGADEDDLDFTRILKLFPPRPEGKGIGGGTQSPPPANEKDLTAQIADLEKMASDPKLSYQERERISTKILNLKLRRDGHIKVT